jgi:hypothetical protein
MDTPPGFGLKMDESVYKDRVMVTKSDVLLYLDCPRHWWAKSHGFLEKVEEPLYEAFLRRQGYTVEALAEQWAREVLLPQLRASYGDGVHLQSQITASSGEYQARADIVITDEATGAWEIYEVKSSTDVKPQHRYDAAFQWRVFSANMPVTKIAVVTLNRDYHLGGKQDLSKLFLIHDLTAEAGGMQEELDQILTKLHDVQHNPDLSTAEACFQPKTCPCPLVCHPFLPAHSLYELGGLRREYRKQWREDGFFDIAEIPDEYPLTPSQRLQKKSLIEGRPIVDSTKLAALFRSLQFPLWFLDYETFQPAVPFLPNYKPYENVPFQFSLHRLDSPESELIHTGFISREPSSAPQDFLKALSEQVGNVGSVIVWNAPFEGGRNRELAQQFPEYREFLFDMNARMYDLMLVFRQQAYVDAKFCGSSSIKRVLPVLAPDLDYKALPIGEGTAAMMGWEDLVFSNLSDEEKDKVRKSLWEYCSLDTLAMYRIWRFLDDLLKA